MKNSVLRLTPLTKILIAVLVIGGVGFGTFKAGLFDSLTKPSIPKDSTSNSSVASTISKETNSTTTNTNSSSSSKMRVSLDEWIGWEPLIYANGGLKTTPTSENGKRGLNVEYVIINDGSQSSDALIKGDTVGAGYTINRTAYLMDKFVNANLDVTMPYISNYSNGGDGVIAKSDINSVNDLVGRKVGIPRFSEAQTLVEWLIQKSDLTDEEIDRIEMVYFDTPDDVANAFFAGRIDAGATWEPYLTQATETTGAKVLFSTKSATNLILDGILFRKDYADAHREDIEKLIDAAFASMDGYSTGENGRYEAIKGAMPLFSLEDDVAIKGMASTASPAVYTDNINLLEGLAREIYVDMSNIWDSVGIKMLSKGEIDSFLITHPDKTSIFDSSYVKSLSDKYSSVESEAKIIITPEVKQVAKTQDNATALLQKNVIINFIPNSAAFLNPEEATQSLNEFIKIAQTLNGAIIQIEGNVANTGSGDADAEKLLSEQRANTVAKYLAQNGVDPNRFIVIGNGTSKPIADNSTETGMAKNRRTDIYFKVIE